MSPPSETAKPSEPRATLLDIWRTRPSRRESGRKLAGVAAAIARRYDIDPILVRIAFVVAAFYAVGILVYLAAWLALPPDKQDPPRGVLGGERSSAHPVVFIAATVAGIAVLGMLLSGDPGVLVGLAVVGGLLYLLHQSRSERGLTAGAAPASAPESSRPATSPGSAGTASTPVTAAGTEAMTESGSTAPAVTGQASPATGTASEATASGDPSSQKPPSWDPLGAAPFAWDLPEPSPPPPPPAKRRAALTMATIGLALLAGGITAAIALSITGASGMRIVVGAMLAVVGLGLVIGSIRHTGRGLILFAIPLLLISFPIIDGGVERWEGAGELYAAPASVAELAPSYERTVGEITLDLRRLDLGTPSAVPPGLPPGTELGTSPGTPPGTPPERQPGTPPGTPMPGDVVAVPPPPAAGTVSVLEPARTKVELEAGEATVLLPPNADVLVRCETAMGEVNCLGDPGIRDGSGSESPRRIDWGADGVPSGRLIELDVEVGTGSAQVHRG